MDLPQISKSAPSVSSQKVSPVTFTSSQGYYLQGTVSSRYAGSSPRARVIMSHGLASSLRLEDELAFPLWSELLTYSSDTELVRFDSVGHGESARSGEPEDYSWRALSQDMKGVLDTLQAENPTPITILGGSSMSAAAALWATVQSPELVRPQGLLLVIPPTAWEKRAEKASDYAKLANIARTLGMAEVLSILRKAPRTPFSARVYPEAAELSLKDLESFSKESYSAMMMGAAVSDLPSRDELKGLAVPTLLLARVEDPAHPLSVAEELLALLPNSRLSVARSLEDVRMWPAVTADWIEKIFLSAESIDNGPSQV